jgi:hypothetical protein
LVWNNENMAMGHVWMPTRDVSALPELSAGQNLADESAAPGLPVLGCKNELQLGTQAKNEPNFGFDPNVVSRYGQGPNFGRAGAGHNPNTSLNQRCQLWSSASIIYRKMIQKNGRTSSMCLVELWL